MDYCIETAPLEKLQNDCLIVGFYQDKTLSASAEQLDRLTQGALRRTIERDELSGKNGEAWLYNRFPGSLPERVVLVGLGENKTLPAKKYRKALAAAAKALKDAPVMTAICTLAEVEVTAQDFAWKTRQIVEVFEDVCYQKAPCKSEFENKVKLKSVRLWASDDQRVLAERGLQQGQAIAAAVALTKELGDLPGNICTPSYLAEQAQQLAAELPMLQAEILEESDMAQLGMGALLAVSRGSRQPAKLITLRYQGGNADAAPFVLIGKGLTFDAGGISIKAAANMDEMKYDMCGGATVLGVLQACARLQLPLNVIGLVPASENLPDGNANKPGDILTSMSGKTIEVLNTDAEGRLILCDTLTYAKRFQPQAVIDIATLTGACIVALGRHPSGLMANDETLCQQLINASERACDSVWRLPLWEEYQEQLKSNFADLANIGGPDGGAITAGCFLSRFAEEFRWAHLDIAGTAWRTGNNNKGATGRPVPLLVQYLLDRAAEHA